MKLLNGDNAIVDSKKLRDYCLNTDNPRGSNKARVFAVALGFTAQDAEILCTHLLEAARIGEAVVGELDLYGQRYTIDWVITTPQGTAPVRSAWIILHGETAPRLVTCYVMKRRPDNEQSN
jgi:hypothetical protein